MTGTTIDLVLDIGNTRTKAALCKNGRVLRWTALPNGDMAALAAWVGTDRPDGIAVGSVAAEDPDALAFLEQWASPLVVTGRTPTPLRMGYATPDSLGVDRLANAVAAAARFPGRLAMVIDLGTCITYDLVSEEGAYLGGAITPGERMRATAMHGHAARLPLAEPGESPLEIGTSTLEALAAGVHHGIIHEMQGFVRSYTHQAADPVVILTGGDAVRFARRSKSGIFALPLLTLEGLQVILQHHRTGPDRPVDGPADGRDGPSPTG